MDGDWSGLPRNVLFDIMDKLTLLDDYVRFGAVCVPWRTVFLQENLENRNKHCSQPFLLVASPEDGKLVRFNLYSLSRERVYDHPHLPLDDNNNYDWGVSYYNKNYIWGSSFGWLMTAEIKGKSQINVLLQNPFLSSNRIIRLPPLQRMIRKQPAFPAMRNMFPNDPCNLWKAVLSSDPLLPGEFAVLGIVSIYKGLAFFKSGNRDWTSVGDWVRNARQNRKKEFMDVLFSQKMKQFYVLRSDGQVFTLDLSSGADPLLSNVMPPADVHEHFYGTSPSLMFLIEDLSSGELLQVHKYFSYPGETVHLDVFKLDHEQQKWIQIHDLGDKIMFLGLNSAVIRSAQDCPGCKPNRVYCTDRIRYKYPLKGRCGNEYGVYSLKENKEMPLITTDQPSGERNISVYLGRSYFSMQLKASN